MRCTISDREYTYSNSIREQDYLSRSFADLARRTFGLDLEAWYRSGYWGDGYIPHVLSDATGVVAAIAVSRFTALYAGERRRYVELGTVMTDPGHRRRGLARWLMHRVLSEWQEHCDAVFLFANDAAKDFYPQFGFVAADEYEHRLPVYPRPGGARRLDLRLAADRELLLRLYSQSNPFSAFQMTDNPGLLMFHCLQAQPESAYFLPAWDAAVIAGHSGAEMLINDIYGGRGAALEDLLAAVATEATRTAVLGFTPIAGLGGQIQRRMEADTTLYILGSMENRFTGRRLMFPLLCRA